MKDLQWLLLEGYLVLKLNTPLKLIELTHSFSDFWVSYKKKVVIFDRLQVFWVDFVLRITLYYSYFVRLWLI